MTEYSRDELIHKIDIILDNIVDERPIDLLMQKFEHWISLEWTSGTISASDFSYAKEYGFKNIVTLHAIRN